MLSHLRVENFAVVEKVEMDFSPQLNIFSGETGTGKSILIDAISLFLKKRIPENSIRNGKNKLIVEALFVQGEEEFVLRREMGKNKSMSYINGELVPFILLKEKAENLLNIYGQNEHVFLLNTANHKLFLDRFSKNYKSVEKMGQVAVSLKKSLKELNELNSKEREASEKLDFINFQIVEIENLKMEAEDEEKLEQRLKILSSSEEILSRSQQLVKDLYQNEDSVYSQISEGLKDLEFLKDIYPEMASFTEEIQKLYNLLPELSASLSTIMGQVEYNENELNEIEDKLLRVDRLKTKYSLSFKGILEKLSQLQQERDLLLNLEFSIKEKQNEVDDLLNLYKDINARVREQRKEKSLELSNRIEHELSLLEMKKAQFLVDFEEIEPDINNISDKGTDKIEFYFTSNPGQKPGRLKDVASGGELSRLMLVLKSLVEDEQFSTHIFDEIDSGIGGKTAQFVGEKLKRISRSNQVICISHLPQIVSFADRHFLIQKEFRDEQTFSFTTELSYEETVQEIARLMAGSAINENVIEAAKNLLKNSKERS